MRQNVLTISALFVILQYAVAASAAVPDIGIGGDETDPHTHLRFEGIPKDSKIVSVSTH
jgi:hypothetical protein